MKSKKTYKKVASYEAKKKDVKTCLLLFSGGLDTSIMLKWIHEHYNADIIALTLDLGQQNDDLQKIKEKALMLGAKDAITLDVKDEFANEYLFKGIKANAAYQGDYHLSTPMGRPLIAKKAAETAKMYGADAVAHGCTGKGNDQVRLDSYIVTINPDCKIIAPVREWDMDRQEQIDFAEKNSIPVSANKDNKYSVDDNMWGVTWEGGEIEHPHLIPKLEEFAGSYAASQNPPDKDRLIKLEFENGMPIAVNSEIMNLSKLISELNEIGNEYGIGTAYVVEDRVVGLKNRGVYEHPGAHILLKAHKSLEKYVSTRVLNELKDTMDIKWGYLCYEGKWFDPAFDAINAFNDSVNYKVTGEVTLNLSKGKVDVVAMESPFALTHASFNNGEAEGFNVNASAGFIEINSMQMRNAYQVAKNNFIPNQPYYE